MPTVTIEIEFGQDEVPSLLSFFADLLVKSAILDELALSTTRERKRSEQKKQKPTPPEHPAPEQKQAQSESELLQVQDDYIIAERLFNYQKGRFPSSQIQVIKYIYSRGGMAPLRDALSINPYAVPRVLRRGLAYITNIGPDKVIVLEDKAKQVLDEIYGRTHEGEGSTKPAEVNA